MVRPGPGSIDRSLEAADGPITLLAAAALLGIGITWGFNKWKRAAESGVPAEVEAGELVEASVEVPECMTNFGTYLTAAREARLSPEIVEQLATDLTAFQAYSEEGNAVSFTLDELLPCFETVTAPHPQPGRDLGRAR